MPVNRPTVGAFSPDQFPVFNVKNYGAVGNGTSNDQTAVNAAITAMTTNGGGILWFPYTSATNGYLLSGALTSLPSNCWVSGPPGTVLTCGGNCFTSSGKSNIFISNLTINQTGTAANRAIYHSGTGSNIRVYDVTLGNLVMSASTFAIYVEDHSNVIIQGCTTGTAKRAIVIEGTGAEYTDCQIINCSVICNGGAGYVGAIHIGYECRRFAEVGNYIFNTPDNGMDGDGIFGTVSRNEFKQAGGGGHAFQSDGGRNIIISNNVFDDSEDIKLSSAKGVNGIIIKGNYFKAGANSDGSQGLITVIGLSSDVSKYIYIHGNMINGNNATIHGIYIYGSSNDSYTSVLVQSCYIFENMFVLIKSTKEELFIAGLQGPAAWDRLGVKLFNNVTDGNGLGSNITLPKVSITNNTTASGATTIPAAETSLKNFSYSIQPHQAFNIRADIQIIGNSGTARTDTIRIRHGGIDGPATQTLVHNIPIAVSQESWFYSLFGRVVPNASIITGTATAGGATTITDGGAAWTTNAATNDYVQITGGLGAGQTRKISSNTGTVITVSAAWSTNPDNTSTYAILAGTIHITHLGSAADAGDTTNVLNLLVEGEV